MRFSNEKGKYGKYTNKSCDEIINTVYILLDDTYVRFSNKVNRQVGGNTMDTNCAPLIGKLFLYCYDSLFVTKLSKGQSKLQSIDIFNKTNRNLDDICS